MQRTEDAVEIDVDDPLEGRGVDLADRSVARDAGVGEDEVDAPEPLRSGVDRKRQRLCIAYVGLPPGMSIAEVAGDTLELLGLEPDQRDVRSPLGEALGDARSDTACGACDNRDLTGQIRRHVDQDTGGIRYVPLSMSHSTTLCCLRSCDDERARIRDLRPVGVDTGLRLRGSDRPDLPPIR